MKHLLLILIVIGLVVVGCNGKSETPTPTITPETAETPEVTVEPTPKEEPTEIVEVSPIPTGASTPIPTPTSNTPDNEPTPTEEDIISPSPSPDSIVDGYPIDLSSPLKTVTSHFEGNNDGEFEAACTCWWEDDECLESFEEFKESFGDVSMSISNLEMTLIIELGPIAWVEVNYEMVMKASEMNITRKPNEIVELEQKDGNWLIWGIEDKEEDAEYYRDRAIHDEYSNVRMAVSKLMVSSDPPIENLDTDTRIVGYADNQSHPTNDMTNDGLITLAIESVTDGGRINPVSYHLWQDYTGLYYIVDAQGNVRCFLDEKGEEEIQVKELPDLWSALPTPPPIPMLMGD